MYRFTFYLAGVYVGADDFRCKSMAHALRQAQYVRLAYVRNAVDRPFDPLDVRVEVESPCGETAAHASLATLVS